MTAPRALGAAPQAPARTPAPSRVGPGLAITVSALLALALTAWRYDAKPLWRDEVYTLSTAGRPLTQMFELLVGRDAGLSVYYVLMHGWLLVSHDEAWMRLPSAIAAVAAVALSATLARRIGGDGVALVAGTTTALSQALITHAQEARPYTLVIAATTATALLALESAQTPSRRRWIALSAAGALAVGLHPLVALPAVAGIFAAVWLRPGRAARHQVIRAGAPAAALGIVLVLIGSAQAVINPPARMPLWKLATFWKLFAETPLPGAALAVLAVVGAIALRRRPLELVLLGAWAVLPLIAVCALGLIGGYFNFRYASAALPAAAVLAATGATTMTRTALARWRPTSPGGAAGLAAAVVALAAVLALGPSAVAYRLQPYYFDDAPAAAAQLAAASRRGDAVVFVGSVTRPMLERYLPPGELTSGRLDDALLAPGSTGADTRGGLEVPDAQRRAALARYTRVWVVGTTAVASGDLKRDSTAAAAAMAGRTKLSRTDHGHVRVELWTTPRR